MNKSAETLTKTSIEAVSEENPVSDYSISFVPPFMMDAGRDFDKTAVSDAPAKPSFSRKISRWQKAFIIAAILTVAALHFVIQSSFVESETGKNLSVDEIPAQLEQIPPPIAAGREDFQPGQNDTTVFKAKKINEATPKILPQIKPRQNETDVSKPVKKKDGGETRAERLRRAEKILTGI